MAKAKSARKNQELYTPTTTSRVLTWVVLLTLPLLGYVFGTKMQEVKDNVRFAEYQATINIQRTPPPTVTVTPSLEQ